MTKIALAGAAGRMGRMLVAAISEAPDAELVAAFDAPNSPFIGMDAGEVAGVGANHVLIGSNLASACDQFEVLIDFTLPEPTLSNVAICAAARKPVVIGATGFTSAQRATVAAATRDIPIVLAANYSVGINLLLKLVREAAAVMGQTADIEVIEAHHRHKVDSPSGTAMRIGEELANALGRDLSQCAVYGRQGNLGPRDHQTIGFETIRGGDIVGEHTVLFADLGERLEITHKASSRMTFARGAVRAALWLQDKSPALYDMPDVLA
jgi:4-hydroxy-tetrahydrodipicolinate reductase